MCPIIFNFHYRYFLNGLGDVGGYPPSPSPLYATLSQFLHMSHRTTLHLS